MRWDLGCLEVRSRGWRLCVRWMMPRMLLRWLLAERGSPSEPGVGGLSHTRLEAFVVVEAEDEGLAAGGAGKLLLDADHHLQLAS